MYQIHRLCLCLAMVAGLGLLPSVPANGESIEQVPPRLLIKPVTSERFRISPDGKTMVNVTMLSQQSFLQFTDVTTMSFGEGVNLGAVRVSDLRWLNDDTLLLVVAGNLFTLKVGSNQARPIADFLTRSDGTIRTINEFMRSGTRWKINNMLHDMPDVILLSGTDLRGTNSLYRVNTLTGEMVMVANGEDVKANSWLVDVKGNPALALRARDDGSFLHYVRDPKRDKWVLHDKLHRDGPIKLDFDGSRYLLRRAVALGYGANEQTLYVAENLGTDRYRIVAYNPISGEVIRTVFEDDDYDAYTPGGISDIFLNKDGDLERLLYMRDLTSVVWLTQEGRALQAAIEAKVSAPHAYVLDVSESGDVALVNTIDASGREKIYIYREGVDDLVLHTPLHEHLEAYALPVTRAIRYNARDGHEIEAFLTLPPEIADGERLPLIVMPHGGPFIRSNGHSDAQAQYFASRGYAVIDPNFRGSTGYGQSHLSQGFRQVGGTMIDDIVDSAEWAIEEGIADSDQVFIVGSSYGGYAALMASIRYPDRFAGLVAHAAVSDLGRQIKSLKSQDSDFAFEYWETLMGDVRSNRKTLKAASPLYLVDKLTVQHLLFHGARDRVVDVEQTELLEKALLDRGREANVKILARTGHEFGQMSDHLYYLEQTMKHLERWRSDAASAGQTP